MRRTVGLTGLQAEQELELINGGAVRRWLDELENPVDEATSQALFDRLMVRLAERERRHRRVRRLAQLVRTALAAAMTGAGAYRLLTR